jgi:uncharacterized protein YjbI with pentapeptide repeats
MVLVSLTNQDLVEYINKGKTVPPCIVTGSIIFTDNILGNTNLSFITFEDSVHISSNSESQRINFTNCTFKNRFTISSATDLNTLTFTECIFEQSVHISKANIETFSIVDTTFKSIFFCDGISAKQIFLLSITSERGKIIFVEPKISLSFTIAQLKKDSELLIYSLKKNSITANNPLIKSILLEAHSQFSGSIIIADIGIESLTLEGDNNLGRLFFQNLTLTNAEAVRFTNNSICSFSTIHINSGTLKLLRSNLGSCQLYDVDFTNFKTIIIDNSIIQDIVSANVSWCTNIQSTAQPGTKSFQHARETYRQLKNVMIRQNDKVMELEYHKKEMDNYRSSIKGVKEKWADRFILWTNRISNHHGLSYVQPLKLLLPIALLVYVGNNLLLGKTHFDITTIPKYSAQYLESLNPIRKFESIYGKESITVGGGFAQFFDVLFRLISSYLIFQFISAFRKYAKK